jgi:protocatechuate 3,4-dioxygenase beta subunit
MKMNIPITFLFCTIFSSACISQPVDQIKILNTKLAKGETTISNILTDTTYMSLHSLTPFREIIKQNAKAEKIRLNTANEPGTKITVKGMIKDASGNPAANKLVYVYQTSSEGWYSDTAPHILKNEGDRRHARLFGYFKTNATGGFEFYTVKPSGYPHSSLPAHIHIEIALDGGNYFISELLFDDDPRLVGEIRERSVREKFFIVKNTGTATAPVYEYTITTVN